LVIGSRLQPVVRSISSALYYQLGKVHGGALWELGLLPASGRDGVDHLPITVI
jgi:hypothetical protein